MSTTCIFCKICTHEEIAEVYYEDDEVIVFKDIKPASKFHLLSIPKKHITGANQLTKNDIPLVQKLIDVALNVLRQKGDDLTDVRLGFHWPPFNSVGHLHMHAISPVSQMKFIGRQIFHPNTPWFVTTDYVLNRLEGTL